MFAEIKSPALENALNTEFKRHNLHYSPNGELIFLAPNTIRNLEASLNAHLYYEPGVVAATFVPINDQFNPIRIYNRPTTKFDSIPQNRAIAKIGEVYAYWWLFEKSIHEPAFDLSNAISFQMLPIFCDDNDHLEIELDDFYQGHRNYRDHTLPHYVVTYNYGGDADFTGVPGQIPTTIPFRNRDGKPSREVTYFSLGIPPTLIEEMHEGSLNLRKTVNSDQALAVQTYQKFSEDTTKLIQFAQKHQVLLNPFNIIVTYYNKREFALPELSIDNALREFQIAINQFHRRNLNQTESVKAASEFASILGQLYDQAATHYVET